MNKYLTCPDCKGVLKIIHYSAQHPSGPVIVMSGLACGCGYKKESKMPEELFSTTHEKEIEASLNERGGVI